MRSAMRGNADLIVSGLGALGAVVGVVAAAGPLRMVLGLTLCLFLPGYALTAALYARADDLHWAERIALSVGSSVVLLVLIALALSYSPWAHDPQSTAVALGGAIMLSALVAWLHRLRIGNEGPRVTSRGWVWLPTSKFIIVTLTTIAILALGLSWLGRPMPSEAFTAFSTLRSDGTSQPYAVSGRQLSIIVRVANHEGHQMSYRVAVLQAGSIVATMQAVVANGMTWRCPLSVPAPGKGPVRFQLLLFRMDRPHHVYRRLLLRPAHR